MPLEVFDFAEQGMVTGSRDTTTVATQALYLLNDPFVRQQALTLAEPLLPATETLDDAGRDRRSAYPPHAGPAGDRRRRVEPRCKDYLRTAYEADGRASAKACAEQPTRTGSAGPVSVRPLLGIG